MLPITNYNTQIYTDNYVYREILNEKKLEQRFYKNNYEKETQQIIFKIINTILLENEKLEHENILVNSLPHNNFNIYAQCYYPLSNTNYNFSSFI